MLQATFKARKESEEDTDLEDVPHEMRSSTKLHESLVDSLTQPKQSSRHDDREDDREDDDADDKMSAIPLLQLIQQLLR